MSVAKITSKILAWDEVEQICDLWRDEGKKIALCTGRFDQPHAGHIIYLNQAAGLARVLIVSVTSDRFAGKDPRGVLMKQDDRAMFMSSLEQVDYVVIDDNPNAVEIIRKVRPEFYVKGSDYNDDNMDPKELEAVRSYGGKVVYTKGRKLSSSAMKNHEFNGFAPEVRKYLEDLRPEKAEILAGIERLGTLTATVVGEKIEDIYRSTSTLSKSSKSNLLAVRFHDEQRFLGGAANVANLAAAFCQSVDLITALGDGEIASQDCRVHEDGYRENVHLFHVKKTGRRITKTRYLDHQTRQKLFEVYDGNDGPLKDQDGLADLIRLHRADVTIAADFGHGLIGLEAKDALYDAKFLAVNCQSNAGNYGFNKVNRYAEAKCVIIDEGEARLTCGDRYSPVADLIERIEDHVTCDSVIVTCGKEGCMTLDRLNGWDVKARAHRDDKPMWHPAFSTTAVDTVGSGDCFLALTSLLLAAGIPMKYVGFLGNCLGALKVQIVGPGHPDPKVALIKAVEGLLA